MNPAPSFRDPAGTVTVTQDRVTRTVFSDGVANLNACLKSPAARRFVASGSLIATLPLAPAGEKSGGLVPDPPVIVEHPRIPFISYSHEWPPAMLHAAARLTLDLCEALIEEGLGIKDATPSNVLFRGPHPVFIDVLSIEQRAPLDPIWLADAQFARTFLIPLLLNRRTGYALDELFLSRRDGIDPEEAVRRLPGLRRWFPPDLGLVTLPARAGKFQGEGLYRPRQSRDAGEAQFILSHHFRALRKKLNGLDPATLAVTRQDPAIDEHSAARREFVESRLGKAAPGRVLDIACGSGQHSLIAAKAGASVVSIDRDPEAVSTLWRAASAEGADILPLVVSFARPTPAAGWRCQEHLSFPDRGNNYFDCVLLLNSMQHFMVADQIPPVQIFAAAAELTTRWLLVEYVGPHDPAFRRLARGRDALYGEYNRSAFETAARSAFEISESVEIPSADRAFYLLQRKS